MKKLNVVKQTVSKKIMTRPANNGCGKDSFVSHAIIKRDFGGSTRDVTGKIAPFKMANVSNLEELLQIENGLLKKKTNGTFSVLDIFTKNLCENKMNVFWIYMPFKQLSLSRVSRKSENPTRSSFSTNDCVNY